MEAEELRKVAKELYDFEGRYGGHHSVLWECAAENIKKACFNEARFLVDTFLPRFAEVAGYVKLKPGEHIEGRGNAKDAIGMTFDGQPLIKRAIET